MRCAADTLHFIIKNMLQKKIWIHGSMDLLLELLLELLPELLLVLLLPLLLYVPYHVHLGGREAPPLDLRNKYIQQQQNQQQRQQQL